MRLPMHLPTRRPSGFRTPLLLGSAFVASAFLLVNCGGGGDAGPSGPSETETHTVTVTITGDGTGTVTSSPAGISCTADGGTCQAEFDEGTSVSLTATPGADSELVAWGGPCTGAGACSETVDGDVTITAEFDDTTRESGTVGASGGSVTYDQGDVTLTIPAGALAGNQEITIEASSTSSLDAEWDDFIDDIASVLQLGPDGLQFAEPITVETTVADPFPGDELQAAGVLLATSSGGEVEALGSLTTTRVGGSLEVTGQIDHFSPLVRSNGNYNLRIDDVPESATVGQEFTIHIHLTLPGVSSQHLFRGATWEAANSGPLAPVEPNDPSLEYDDPLVQEFLSASLTYVCTEVGTGRIEGSLAINIFSTLVGELALGPVGQDVECVAPVTPTLTVTRSGDGSGSVSSSPGGIDCPDDCEEEVEEGSIFDLTASPAMGHVFCGWTTSAGGASEDEVLIVQVDSDLTVDACFDAPDPPSQLSLRYSYLSHSNGQLSSGTQNPPLVDDQDVQWGRLPLTFMGPAFVGSNPDRLGLGQDGSILFGLGDATVPDAFSQNGGPQLEVCGTNNAESTEVRMRRLDADGNTLEEQILQMTNQCFGPFVFAPQIQLYLAVATYVDFIILLSRAVVGG